MSASETLRTVVLVHREGGLVAVAKPSGMLVHRGWGRAPVVLVDLVRGLEGCRSASPVHRIDRGASGVVLFATDSRAARVLAEQQAGGEIRKTYLALVRGRSPDEAVVDHAIPRREGGPRVGAVTSVRRLATVEAEPRDLSLVEACPATGRLHQVRRHLKHLGHPLLGDANYGRGDLNREVRSRYGLARLALHLLAVELPSPETGESLRIEAPLPEDLAVPLGRMGFDLESLGTGASPGA